MGVLPAIPVLLLSVVTVWFLWPLVADPIARVANPARRDLKRSVDRTADHLFDAWAERS